MLDEDIVATLQELVTELDTGVLIVVVLTVALELIALVADKGTTLPDEIVVEVEVMNGLAVQTVALSDTVVVEEHETADEVNTDEDDTPTP